MLPLLLVAQLVPFVSGFAQADSRAALQRTSLTAMRAYTPARPAHDDVQVPRNLIVARRYEQTIAAMRAFSPTFRRQCLRLASASHLTVTLGIDPSRGSNETRAFTTITRNPSGDVSAVVRIRDIDHAPELIAHEIEHIIEQLDGVDLGTMASLDATGVHRCDCRSIETFETIRAVSVGEQVARELADQDR